MSDSFWQIGGWKSHVRPEDGNIPRKPEVIAETLFRYAAEDGELTLTLGILPNGASYLLLLDYEVHPAVRDLLRTHWRPFAPSRFISLSPTAFRTPGALVAKLIRHAQKPKKKNKKAEDPDRDRSQANTHYTSSGEPHEILTSYGLNRATYEYHRLFYRLCRGAISESEHGIERVPWLDNIRARSFAYNLHEASRYRLKEERKREPNVLDIGIAEWILPGGSIDLTVERHDYFTMKTVLRNPNPGKSLFGEARQASKGEISDRLKECFKEEKDAPIMLFVQDAEEALDVLSYFGVEISRWTTHFESVVGRQVLSVGSTYSEDRGRSDSFYKRERFKSERSQSPRRRDTYKRERSPACSAESQVYVVDVPQLYESMKRIPPTNMKLTEIAKELDVRLPDPNGGPLQSNGTGWCAGNECRLLAYIWRALVDGNAIDEQLQYLEFKPAPVAVNPVPAAPVAPPPANNDDDDDDVDPNDFVPTTSAAGSGQMYKSPYDDSEDEDYQAW